MGGPVGVSLSKRACSLWGRLRWRYRRARSRRPRSNRPSMLHTQSSDAQGGQERRLHSCACQGRSESVGIAVVTTDGKVYIAGDVKTEARSSRSRRSSRWLRSSRSKAWDRSKNGSASMRRAHGPTRSSRSKPSGPSSGRSTEMNPRSILRRSWRRAWRRERRRMRCGRRSSALTTTPQEDSRAFCRTSTNPSPTQPAQRGDRRAHARVRLYQRQLAAGGRSFTRQRSIGVTRRIWRRWRERWHQAAGIRSPASRSWTRPRPRRPRGDVHRRFGRRLREMAVSHRLPAKSDVGGGIIAVSPGKSASPSSPRRSTTPATACARSGRPPRSRRGSMANPYAVESNEPEREAELDLRDLWVRDARPWPGLHQINPTGSTRCGSRSRRGSRTSSDRTRAPLPAYARPASACALPRRRTTAI